MGRSWKNFEEHDGKVLDCLEQTVSRNMGVKDCWCGLRGNEERDLGNWREGVSVI